MGAIARKAGVSLATVDRVINNREGVRDRTREVVLNAAWTLGYFGTEVVSDTMRMDFVLPAGPNSFMAQLRSHLMEEAARNDVEARLHQTVGFDPGALSEKLSELEGVSDAVAVVAIDHPSVRDRIETLSAGGAKVATLVSDIPNVTKIGYVGVDNRAAGRLAGYLIGRFLHNTSRVSVAIFIGSPSYRGHEEREMGIRSILSQDYPELSISGIQEVNDDRDRAYEETRKLLAAGTPDAIYNIGSGNQGIALALKEAGVQRDVVFIGHDLTPATRTMLLDGTMDAVIDQNPRVEAREVVKLLISARRGTFEAEYPPRLQVIFRENLP